jgi:hypothetical protein
VSRQRAARGAAAGARESPDAGGPDVIELGGHPLRWPWRGAPGRAAGIALAALLAGLVLGFIGGHLQAASTARTASTAPATAPGTAPGSVPGTVLPAGGTSVGATGSRCAVQVGRTLQLGIEIMNRSSRNVTLRHITPVLPLSGLRPIASRWGTCGSLPEPGIVQATSLAPGATGWLTVTFDVLVVCPQPLPVGFIVSFTQAGRLVTARFDSFPDLGQVRYKNCRTDTSHQ